MRIFVIAALLIGLGLGTYFYMFGSQPQTGVVNQATPAPEVADVTSAPEVAEAAPKSAEPAEAVEESSGELAPEDENAEHNLRLASTAKVSKAPAPSRFKAGTHYREIVPAQPKVSGTDKIEVVEVFWYGCGHCFAFDPSVKNWAAAAPADVSFVRMPAIWNSTLETHARAFYTADALARSGKLAKPGAFHDAFFEEIHVNRQPLGSDRSIRAFFGRFGVTGEDYDAAAKSFEVDQKIRNAKDLTRRYGITGVPAIVVNGRYTSLSGGMKGYDDYIGLMDALSEIER